MPMYYFLCPDCGHTVRKILTVEQAQSGISCPNCSKSMKRDPKPPSSQAVETLDNGIMTRRLERLVDAERLFSERNEATKKAKGES